MTGSDLSTKSKHDLMMIVYSAEKHPDMLYTDEEKAAAEAELERRGIHERYT